MSIPMMKKKMFLFVLCIGLFQNVLAVAEDKGSENGNGNGANGAKVVVQESEALVNTACGLALGDRGTNGTQSTKEKALKAAESFRAYFSDAQSKVFERDYAIRAIAVGLLAKEHVLLMGPPGIAKSRLIRAIYGNILEDDGEPSYFKLQMNGETTLSDTHGPINFKTVEDTGRVERLYEEGMLGHRLSFLDEIFDVRPNALRNILDALEERMHGKHRGKTWSVALASNKNISQVYQVFGGGKDPQAVLNRVSFVINIPGDFEFAGSYRALVRDRRRRDEAVPPKFYFSELQALHDLTRQVQIPNHLSDILGLMIYKAKPEIEAMEEKDKREYLEKQRNGDFVLAPWRATKYLFPRTAVQASNVLEAMVVSRWIESGGKTPLVANMDDIAELCRFFFPLVGPKDEFAHLEMSRTSDLDERRQLETVIKERSFYLGLHGDMKREFNEVLSRLNLPEIAEELESYPSMLKKEKEKFLEKLRGLYWLAEVKQVRDSTPQEENDIEKIAYTSIAESIHDWLQLLMGQEATTTLVAKWNGDLTDTKRQEILAQNPTSSAVNTQTIAAPQVQVAATRVQSIQPSNPDQSSFLLFQEVAKDIGLDLSTVPGLQQNRFEFAMINPGSFTMGNSGQNGEPNPWSNETKHQVNITKPFEIAKFPLLQIQDYIVRKKNNSKFKEQSHSDGDYFVHNGVGMNFDHPAESITWDQATTELLRALNEKEEQLFRQGKKTKLCTYRLPTESEWEYAVRAGTQTAYYFGNPGESYDAQAARLGDFAHFSSNSGNRTHAVGKKMKPNANGLYEISGNVWELTQDLYAQDLGTRTLTDPVGTAGSGRVVRGGSWSDDAQSVRSASRSYVIPWRSQLRRGTAPREDVSVALGPFTFLPFSRFSTQSQKREG